MGDGAGISMGGIFTMHRFILALASFSLFVGTVYAAQPAVDLPNRPIRLLAVSPPGGPGDFVARLVAPRLADALDRNVVVDNRASVNGILASEIAAKAAPDGTTLIVGNNGTHAINPSLYRTLPYDPLRDFTPICELVFSGSVLSANLKLAPKTFHEFIAAAKKQPNQFNIGVPGANAQVSVEMLKSVMGIQLNNVPFKGSAPTEIALISGEINVSFLSLPSASVHVKSGRIKAYATSVAKRSPLIPDVPTFDELGVANFRVGQWHGLWGPARLPDRYVRHVHAAMARMFESADVKELIAARGSEIVINTPEQFAKLIRSDLERYRRILQAAGVQPQ